MENKVVRALTGGKIMFKVNDVVVYGTQGVCEIVGIDEKRIDGASKNYFVLKPKDAREAIFYVPTWNEKAWGKMRRVLTQQEVDALIDSMPDSTPIWIANENERKEAYKKILASGDQAAILSMVQALYAHKTAREAEGKRLHMSDEYFMKDAEQLLYNEWQYVLNVDKDGLMAYIFSRIESRKES
jgi:CarD family transcriptional regulator